jgi:hypothetical protein
MDRTYKYQYVSQELLLGLVLLLLAALTAFGQNETQGVDRSSLAGVRLPSGAQRVNEASVPTEIKQALTKIVDEGQGKIRQGESEVLIWTGSDLRSKGSNSIVNSLAGSLKSGGWEYEVSGSENGVTIFSVLRSEPERRGILGLFTEADGVLMFAWTEVHAANGPQTVSKTPVITATGDVSDYTFATPSGWSRGESTGKITLTSSDGEKSLTFLPPMDSTGDLQRDAERLLWQVYKGYGPWSGNGFTPDYGVFERGKTAQGLEYFKAYRYAVKPGDDQYFPKSRFDATILVVKLGGKVAVVVGRSPFQSDYAGDSAGNALDRILYDLRFKSANNAYDLKREILGSWSAASSTVAIAYTFNANGTFNKGGAISFRTRHDDTRDKVTTTSYGMSDKYSLAGNVISQTYRSTGEVSKYKVRVYETKYDKDPWQAKMGFLSVADPKGGTIVFRKPE